MSRWSRIVSWLLCILVTASSFGCAAFNSTFGFKKEMPKATAADPAVEVVCLWTPGEGCDPDGVTPRKGFMGQIMFLSAKNSTPLVIEGDVRIYLFDDQGTKEEQVKPLRQFDFDNGSWAVHLTETSYGPTYTVFIPYVRNGVSNAHCTLRLRFKPKVGPVVFSDFANMQLSGPKKLSTGEDAKPFSNEEVNRETVDAMVGSLLRTTTIATGPNAQSMQAAPIAKKETNSSQVQQASHEVPAPPANDPAADHIRRLELMMEKLLEQQNASAAKPTPWTRSRQEAAPAELVEHPASSEPDAGSQRTSRRMRIRRNDEDVSARSSPARRIHPLEVDETVEASQSSDEDEQRQESPLDDADDSSSRTTLRPRPPSSQGYR